VAPGTGAVNLVCSRVVTYLYVVNPMPLNIRSQETEELASALAKLTGETKTEAVTQALRERIQRVRRARAKRRLADELDEIALHCCTLPVLDRRSADEIIGYDENGLPR
jgi:antitoxin VapB